MPANPFALEIDHVTKSFRRHHNRATSLKQFIAGGGRGEHDVFVALKDVSFDVRRGEVFGVIGHNGSGKSTLLKCMARILRPNSGEVRVHDRMSALLELGAGFHPELTGRENVFLNAALLGMSRHEISVRYDDIVEFSGLDPQFLETPVKTYSSGMYVRLAFSIAINVEPALLIIDEILAVGDIDFQRKCVERFLEFRSSGRTTVLVTHDLASVRTMCDRAVWLDHGKLRGNGDPAEIVDGYTESMSPVAGRVTQLGTFREGSGEIQLTAVHLEIDGKQVTRARTGDDVTLVLDWVAAEPVTDPCFGFTVVAANGLVISDPSSADVALTQRTARGEGRVEVRLPSLPLLPGTYQLHCTISDQRRQHIFDRAHSAVEFDVMAGDPLERFGVVTLRPQWTVVE